MSDLSSKSGKEKIESGQHFGTTAEKNDPQKPGMRQTNTGVGGHKPNEKLQYPAGSGFGDSGGVGPGVAMADKNIKDNEVLDKATNQ